MANEPLRRRLQRLRREGPVEQAARREPLPAWMKQKLARSGGHGAAAGPDAPGDELAGPLTSGLPADLGTVETPDGTVAARSAHYGPDHRHGAESLSAVDAASAEDFELLTGDPALGALDLRRAVYLDTETTGLSGGAGTYVFLVGLGTFAGAGFALWQGFLREPAEERALLVECAERIRAGAGVVSFFGKSFDRHRLEDKMRLHGVAPPFDDVPHLDLYHPLRRLYRDAYEDSRLKTLERELCGVVREDDLPGAFAPAAWFDYLAGRPHRLEGVLRHNADDVLSLVALAAHVGRASAAPDDALAGDAGRRALGVARSMFAAGRRAEAAGWIERRLSSCGVQFGETQRALRVLRADALRLSREPERALALYAELAAEPADGHAPHCLAQLAKLHEHHRRDRAVALECCAAGLALLERGVGVGSAELRKELEARLRRLAGGG